MSGWPWPLDAVQGWFDGLWNWVGDAAKGAVSSVSGWLNDAVSDLKSWVGHSTDWLWDQVKPVFGPLAGWASSAVNSFWLGLRAFAEDPVGFLDGAISSITTTIDRGFSDVGSWLYTQISNGLAGASQLLIDIGSGISKLLDGAAAAIGKSLGDIGSFISTTIWGWVDGALRWATDCFRWLNDQVSLAESNIINTVGAAIGGVGEAITAGVGSIFGPVIDPFVRFLSTFTDLAAVVDVSGITDQWAAVVGKLGFSPEHPVQAVSPEGRDTYLSDVDKWAYGIDDMVRAMIQVGQVVEAVSLGQMDVSFQAYFGAPRIRAFTGAASKVWEMEFEASIGIVANQQFLAKYTPMLPGPGDLIRFVVREVITPARFAETMPLHGYSPEWAKAYWEAHWVLPGPRDLYDSFHRGNITTDELDKFIVWHDYSPEPRPGISKSDLEIMRGLLKTLVPRVDLRYAWESGSISDEELVERYRKLGYEEDSELMAEIQKGRALTEEVTKVRTEWLSDFIGGYIDEDTVRANLEAIGTGIARIEYYIVYARMRRERTAKKDLLGIYEDGYVKDLLTDDDLEARAGELIVDDDARNIYLQKAYVVKYKKPAPPKAPTVDKALLELRKYQVSYAVEAYRKYAVEKPELVDLLVAADVDPFVAAARADYEELKRPLPKPTSEAIARAKETVRIQGLELKTAVEEYRDGTIDASGLFSKLQLLGYSDALASAITQLEVVKAYKPPVPPKAEVVKTATLAYLATAFREGVLSEDEFRAELTRRAYAPADIDIIVSVETLKIKKGPGE